MPLVTPTVTPRNGSASSGKCRRFEVSRASRAAGIAARAAAAAGPAAAGPAAGKTAPAMFDELHQAVRNDFASVLHELTRFRAELVVVKTQTATVVHGVEGLAAAADGSHSGNGAVLERLAQLQGALDRLGDRLLA
eukprot:TRINITY_DN8947_c0_g1_i1.p1 TRINITY_DN8947_c0_g1~~TRINITY_DN8947_c0_g1_i1.p1  ORF type:complete len:136 (-),score=21.76 TRINITY_DN8947_c0_g1_i1:586-993(-)